MFLFGAGSHYTTVIVNATTRQIAYIDGLHPDAETSPWEVQMIRQFYQDESSRQQRLRLMDDWPLIFPTAAMEPQRPHRLNTQHPDLATHKDCGLYALSGTLLYLADHPLTILTPVKVHELRRHLAYRLLSSSSFNINAILFRKRRRSPTSHIPLLQQRDTLDTHNTYQVLSDDPPITSARRATLRPRHSRSTHHSPPLPDRIRVPIILSDPALEHTYISESTLPGAGKGLFSARDFDGNDEDSAMVGEYFGGEGLTAEAVSADNYHSDYAIIKGGIVRDAWDPHTKKVLCASGYINDPLDEQLENTQWDVHQKRLIR